MHDGTCRPPTFVSLFQAVQVELVAGLFAGVHLKRSEGLRGGLDSSPRRQSLLLLLVAGGRRAAPSRRPRRRPRGIVGGRGGGFGGGHVGGVTEVEQSLSVFRPQQLQN